MGMQMAMPYACPGWVRKAISHPQQHTDVAASADGVVTRVRGIAPRSSTPSHSKPDARHHARTAGHDFLYGFEYSCMACRPVAHGPTRVAPPQEPDAPAAAATAAHAPLLEPRGGGSGSGKIFTLHTHAPASSIFVGERGRHSPALLAARPALGTCLHTCTCRCKHQCLRATEGRWRSRCLWCATALRNTANCLRARFERSGTVAGGACLPPACAHLGI